MCIRVNEKKKIAINCNYRHMYIWNICDLVIVYIYDMVLYAMLCYAMFCFVILYPMVICMLVYLQVLHIVFLLILE